ncbi:DUF6489 family protein [Caulobacter sp. S45]|uniref:DUF6489 family protein n=1 Tax=Caulobacter sp. S45 TaxID=1641861 RepID=UPI0015759E50|nr:DUF6489 family protein [Caulobacter sp. S45]
MKFTVEADCTPVEARQFLGLPDVTPLNEQMVKEMSSRMSGNMSLLKPEELMKTWMSFGGQAQEQFMRMMTSAAAGGLGATTSR